MINTIKTTITVLFLLLFIGGNVYAADYYIAPDKNLDGSNPTVIGNDNNPGTQALPIKTFNRAWQLLLPGDTLYLMDGLYLQDIHPNTHNGQPDNPITIKTLNDGQAIIDGEGIRVPVQIGESWPGPIGNWFVLEGIVAKNSSNSVYQINGDNNILRRVTGINADTDTNNHVFVFAWANNNLVEDCLAVGTGRKMIVAFDSNNITIRRCVSDWEDWRGLDFCAGHWPWGDGVQIYNSQDSIIENVIDLSSQSGIGIGAQNNSGGTIHVNNNKILGSISLNGGMDHSNKPSGLRYWGRSQQPLRVQPYPADIPGGINHCGLWDPAWPSQRAGFQWFGSNATDILYQDIIAINNAGVGFRELYQGSGPVSGIINNATLVNNGFDAPSAQGETNKSLVASNNFAIDNTSYIDNPSQTGTGARLKYRYIDGMLTNQHLWPWPMESRIYSEIGKSVTCEVVPLINQLYAQGKVAQSIDNFNVTNFCTNYTSPTPYSLPGDANGDRAVNILDYVVLNNTFGSITDLRADFNNSGNINILDYQILANNFGRSG